jgi:hypothetical protein
MAQTTSVCLSLSIEAIISLSIEAIKGASFKRHSVLPLVRIYQCSSNSVTHRRVGWSGVWESNGEAQQTVLNSSHLG